VIGWFVHNFIFYRIIDIHLDFTHLRTDTFITIVGLIFAISFKSDFRFDQSLRFSKMERASYLFIET